MNCEHLPTLLVKKIHCTIRQPFGQCCHLVPVFVERPVRWFLDVCHRYHSIIVDIFLDPFPDLVLIQT